MNDLRAVDVKVRVLAGASLFVCARCLCDIGGICETEPCECENPAPIAMEFTWGRA